MEYTDEDKAIAAIRNYLNVGNKAKWTDDYIKENFAIAIDSLINQSNSINAVLTQGIVEKEEGNSRVAFDTSFKPWTITDNIKSLLPPPFLGVY
ncbi:MAG: hypothetical protein MSA56_10930 [Clostridium sp.]|nr:hypothetical protein [Clostridium sp.]